MKTRILHFLFPLVGGTATSAFASTDGSLHDGGGPLTWFFIGFGALVLMLQAVPAAIMLYSMLKGIFSPSDQNTVVSAHSLK